jgi:hypothetical protein
MPQSASSEHVSTMLSWSSGEFYNSWLFAIERHNVRRCRFELPGSIVICGMVFASIEKARVRGELSFGHFLPPLVCAFAPEAAAVMKREI